jgi:hypothetical protein
VHNCKAYADLMCGRGPDWRVPDNVGIRALGYKIEDDPLSCRNQRFLNSGLSYRHASKRNTGSLPVSGWSLAPSQYLIVSSP